MSPSRWQHRLVVAVVIAAMIMPYTAQAGDLLPSEQPPMTIEQWQPEPGDVFIVDTQANVGYLVHEDGSNVSFPVVTGQRGVVRYIGRVYDATTPARSWTATSKETKGDRITFGKDGTFLRLKNNRTDEETSYGIHTHAYADRMLAREYRFRSMGCIIVSEDVFSIMEATFTLSGNRLRVLTTFGLSESLPNLRRELIK